jgi:archaemetzincin
MKKIKAFFTLSISIIIICCTRTNSQHKNHNIQQEKKHIAKAVIHIQPLGSFPKSTTLAVSKQLRLIYTGSVIINKSIPIPNYLLNNSKSRYRADLFLKFLTKRTKKGSLTIGLTNTDISYTKKDKHGNIISYDFGIIGLGLCPGNSCIASTYRLKGINKQMKIFKVSIHELGHTQGLKHCLTKTCLMRDAKGKDHFDELSSFCAKCKSRLLARGWNLK